MGGSDGTRKIESEIICYKVLRRTKKVSGGIMTVRKGMLRGADGQKAAWDNKEELG